MLHSPWGDGTAAPQPGGSPMAQPFPFETWMNLALCTDLPRRISHSSSAPVPAGLRLCRCNCCGMLEQKPTESMGFGTGSG